MDDRRKRADEFPREVLDLFDPYMHGMIDRRAFLDRARKFAVGGLNPHIEDVARRLAADRTNGFAPWVARASSC